MSSEREKNGDESKGLSSTEYRSRLLNKLNCLVAVLEVAIGKVNKSLETKDTNQERLLRIKANLENTLAICRRAKGTLETKALGTGTKQVTEVAKPTAPQNATFRCYVELSSIDEFRKFKALPAIRKEEVKAVDIEDLAQKLQGNE
ncbi:MAG: hypothetical protein KDC95_15205 [Planctomycetes bacterium]|nr:hypothetical protein [Planctomycetota bacterium]